MGSNPGYFLKSFLFYYNFRFPNNYQNQCGPGPGRLNPSIWVLNIRQTTALCSVISNKGITLPWLTLAAKLSSFIVRCARFLSLFFDFEVISFTGVPTFTIGMVQVQGSFNLKSLRLVQRGTWSLSQPIVLHCG